MKLEEKYSKHYFKRITLEIGNYYDKFQYIEIKNENNKLVLEYTPKKSTTDVLFSTKLNVDYDTFFNELLSIKIENWENEYLNYIDSGHNWNLKMYFKPSIVIEKKGRNNFPNNFIEIVNIFKKYYDKFNVDIKIREKLNENDLLKLYCSNYSGTSFFEVSVGEANKHSNDRRIDIVRIKNDCYKWRKKYSDHKKYFEEIIKNGHNIEIVEIKTKLNRNVIGQIIVGEYLFKKKFNVKNLKKSILYHHGDELLELFCKDNDINLIKY
jgi:hypothetical protein